ncbi:hypothetical protein B566_EDAN002198 [Ephemera danica]|nr:hypothetical protein B566_EDAN002198 [Ephemera danica]
MTELQDELLASLCQALSNDSKLKRRSTLQRLREVTIDNANEAGNAEIVFENVFKPILQCVSDNAEICRDLSINLIRDFIPKLQTFDNYLPYIIKVILKRIGSNEVAEPSEEVRLSLISLLNKIIIKSGQSIFPYNDDIIKIICKCLEDSYPLIKIESCECLVSVTKAIPKQFHVQCEGYINALLSGMGHKHSKVRISIITTTGAVVQHGTHGLVEKVVAPLAERLYDSNPAVRKTVVHIAGHWLRRLPDRYSQFARILPLVLTGLDDESVEVREEALQQWTNAGDQFLCENEEDFKKKMDYISDEIPLHYPCEEQRPSLGCRALVEREAGKLFPAAVAELHDWTLAVQLQAASLTYQLVKHLEHRSVQHAHRLWPELALLCGRSGLDPRLEIKPQLTLGQLRCLACALRGVPILVEPELGTLSSALNATASTSLQPSYQYYMLDCVSEVLRAAKKGSETSQNSCSEALTLDLFTTLLVTQGLEDTQLSEQANRLLDVLATLSGREVSQLFIQFGYKILSSLKTTVPVWTDICADKSQFCAFVSGAGVGIGPHLELVTEILVIWVDKASTAKSLADLVRVAKPLLSWKFLQKCRNNTEYFINKILADAIIPGLVWHAGRIAEVKRSQALVLLLIAISEPLPENILLPLADSLLPLLISALEETNKTIRHHAAHAITTLTPIWAPNLTTTQRLLLALPDHHEALASPTHFEGIQKSLLIHLDDSDPVYQQAILDALKNVGKIGTAQLLGLLIRGKKNFSNQEGWNKLQNYLEELAKDSIDL